MGFCIKLANTRGMCAGVARAIEVVEKALAQYGPHQVWVLHEVVHNQHVVQDLKDRGAHFVESLNEVPDDKVLIFSAHGVAQSVIDKAKARRLKIIDATCPLVSRVHRKLIKAGQEGREAIIIGHQGHAEVIGAIGQYSGPADLVHVLMTPDEVAKLKVKSDQLMFVTQTTLSADETAATVAALRQRFPEIAGPQRDDTCFATQSRQSAVRELAAQCDLVLVAGSANSSNSNRLKEVAQRAGAEAYLIEDAEAIDPSWLQGRRNVGVTAGASAPEYVVTGIIDYLKAHGADELVVVGKPERSFKFPLPEGL